MADTVQVMMEKMIPELEDLQERKLFSKVRLCRPCDECDECDGSRLPS